MGEAEHEVSYRDEKAPLLRKVIAQRMLESKQTVPHFYLTIEVDVKNLIAYRGELNEGRDRKISFNDIIIKAIAMMLTKHPDCNVSYIDDNIRYYDAANVCLAVAIDGGVYRTPSLVCPGRGCPGSLRRLRGRVQQKARDGRPWITPSRLGFWSSP